jgi:putative (di)nucleoside polyphosphate hydrolase
VNKIYRPNVAALIKRSDGRILIGRRSDHPECWQLPQGGIDKGESADEALRREVMEEVGIPAAAYEIEAKRSGYRYDFPAGPDRRGYHGQEQTYFLCRMKKAGEPQIDLAGTCGEFTEVRWEDVASFPVNLAPPMKQAVYRSVLADFFRAAE